MAQPDPLDDALADLAQRFGDIGFVVPVIRELRRNSDRQRPALADELRGLREAITHTIDLL